MPNLFIGIFYYRSIILSLSKTDIEKREGKFHPHKSNKKKKEVKSLKWRHQDIFKAKRCLERNISNAFSASYPP